MGGRNETFTYCCFTPTRCLVDWTVMKTGIHPEYVECQVHCSCGNEFVTRSTVPSLRVELCSECHPFYTGKQKLVDTGGRVERFERRYAKSKVAAKKA